MTTHDKRILNWKTWLAAVAASICIVVGYGSATAQPAEAWVIGHPGLYNMGQVGIGVVHYWPGYDAVLPVGRSTYGLYGWDEAKGFWTGAGYCTNYYYSGPGYEYYYRWTVRGPAEASIPWHQDGAVYSYLC
jgi:hypothetical protein